MTLEQLRIFIAVAEREHITRAAEALHMTQSAVSSAISALESRHAITLFDRVGRAIILNETGRTFLPEAKAVLDRAKAAEAALDDLSGLRRGTLSVMASQTIASYWLPEHLAQYRREYPYIDVDVRFANTDQVADAVDSGEAEVGLVEGVVNRATLSAQVFAQDEMVVVISPAHSWAKATPPILTDVDWIVREEGSGTRAMFNDLTKDVSVKVALMLPGNEAVLGAVEAGLGAALVSLSVARSRIASGSLVVVDGFARQRSFFILHHKERFRTRAANALIDLAVNR
ncbi:LysR family transcriptional regulator [Devosia rhizoryzae]|uniref:LysR family transcriptional regulator n=1 Tax=Devosia rhizoryzae TaxID=2774137 RepID=A0ABX7CAS8_9HYPH|nr:LysR family transcriptional regulator [Devosia rhizoryzae]QQR39041.1 LysR family transcriptional regulator [Devosia rhizoryzae]